MVCGMTASRFLARLFTEPIRLLVTVFYYLRIKIRRPKKRFELWQLNTSDPTKMGGIIPEHHYKIENAEQAISSNVSDSVLIYGCSSGGATLLARISREREGHVAWLYLKLLDGRSYHLPDPDKTYPPANGFLAGGLRIRCLVPLRNWRVSFNGLLVENSKEGDDYTEPRNLHVKFSFVAFMNSFPFDLFTDVDPVVLADYLTTNSSLVLTSSNQFLDQYVQPCNLMGSVVVEGSDEIELYLWGLRKRSRDKLFGSTGPSQTNEFFGYSQEGQIMYSAEYLFPGSKERFSVGHFVERNSLIWPVKKCKQEYDFKQDVFTGLKVNIKTDMYKTSASVGSPHKSMSLVSGNAMGHVVRVHLTTMQLEDGDNGPALVLEHTQTRYESKALEKIEWRLSLSGSDPGKPSLTPQILALDDQECQRSAQSGGKGASLASLNYLVQKYISGFEVPWGFVVTTRAYWEFFSRANLHALVAKCESSVRSNDDTEIKNSCNELMNQVSKAKLPRITQEAIRKQLVVRFPKDSEVRRFAVRSSATGEDSEEMSAAGQMSTILGVEGLQNIYDAIVSCWASQFSFTAIQYKRQNGQKLNSAMAVVVQEMVPADTAGVLFTCDPVTGNPQNVTITANYGLGESVVSGSSEPDTFVVRRNEKNLLTFQFAQVGRKKTKVVMSDVGNVIEKSNEEVETSVCCITKQQALILAETCVKVEEAYGFPLDVEWAFQGGKLFLLQARPVTTFNKETKFEIIHNSDSPIRIEKEYYTKANIGEVMPGFISPITCSVVGGSFTFELQAFFSRRSKYLLPYTPFNGMAWISQGQSFFSMIDNILRFHKRGSKSFVTQAMLYAAFGRNLDDPEMFENALKRHSNYPKVFAPLQFVYVIGDVLFGGRRLNKEMKLAWDNDIDLSQCSNSKEMMHHMWNATLKGQKGMTYHIINTTNSSICNNLILSILAKENKKVDVNVFSDFALILSSCGKLESADIPLSIQRLAKEIRNEIGMERFKEMDPKEALDWLETTESSSGKLYKEFLRRHGHRCLKEFDFYSRPWRMNKFPLVKTLQESTFESNAEEKEELSTNEVIEKLKVPLSRKSKRLLRMLIPLCRGAVLNREKSKSLVIKTIDRYRKAFWTIAEQLVIEGLIPNQELAFFLSHHEILQLIDTRSPALIHSAQRRKQMSPELDNRRYLEICRGIPIAINVGTKEYENFDSDLVMMGTPVSQGVVKGLARVATNLDEASRIQPGEILIAYCTDIAWSPYFPLLGGVATELGGLISHGAVVAREYGLPCVVGVHDATNRFRTGDEVLLDGNTGELKRISSKESERL